MEVLASIMKTLAASDGSAVVIDDRLRALIQKRLLQMLDDILGVCREHNIRYMMSGGSALGTVRHQGFIPWDDDIDLNMERAEFERFLPIFEEKYSDRYKVLVPGRDEEQDYLFIHIIDRQVYARELMQKKYRDLGLTLDIFLIENVPDGKLMRLGHGFLCMLYRYVVSCIRFYENREELIGFLENNEELRKFYNRRSRLGGVFSVIPKKKWLSLAFRTMGMCRNSESRMVSIPSGSKQYFQEMYPRDPFCRTEPAQFEGRQVELTQFWDGYLGILYGDYMKIPPEEKRGKHVFLELDTDALIAAELSVSPAARQDKPDREEKAT